MFLSQLKRPGSGRAVAARDGDRAWIVPGAASTRNLAQAAIAAGHGLEADVLLDAHHRIPPSAGR